MNVYVYMINETEHRLQKVKVGFSWTLLFWTWFFAAPLFIRRVYTWAAGVLAFIVINAYFESFYSMNEPLIHWHIHDHSGLQIGYFLAFMNNWGSLAVTLLSIYLGFKGNEITGRYYLRNGWRFAAPDSPEAQYARQRWGIPYSQLKPN